MAADLLSAEDVFKTFIDKIASLKSRKKNSSLTDKKTTVACGDLGRVQALGLAGIYAAEPMPRVRRNSSRILC